MQGVTEQAQAMSAFFVPLFLRGTQGVTEQVQAMSTIFVVPLFLRGTRSGYEVSGTQGVRRK